MVDSIGGTASATFNLTVNPYPSHPTVNCSSSTPASVGQPVTFTASASGGSGVGYGYSWSGPANGPGSGNQISFTPAQPGPLVESVTVTDSAGQTASNTCTATVQNPGGVSAPPITATPSSLTIGPTGTASHVITISDTAGFSGPVTFQVSGLPPGAIPSFSPSVSSSGSTTLSVTPAAGSPTGTFPIAVTALGSSQSATAYVVLNVAQPFPAGLLTPPPGAFLGGGSTTFTWDAGVGATAYQLLVGSGPGASDIYAGGQTTQQSATVNLPSTPMLVYVTLESLCGGVWQPSPAPPSFPIAPTSPAGPFPSAGYPGTSYSVPNDGTPTTLTFCLANNSGCDATDFGSVAPYLQGCGVFDSGYNPVSSASVTGMNPYDPSYPAAFDVTIALAQTLPGSTYHVGCTFWPAEPSNAEVWWQIQVVDGPPVVSFFQEFPPNPDGSFYVTIWGHNFGPDQGTIQVCIQSGCSNGQMTVCLSESCGDAYYLWSDQQINALIEPGSAPDGIYQWTPCSNGESGTAPICLPVIFLVPFPETSPTAAIYSNGRNISSQTQTVVVGQQIPLVGVTNLPGSVQQFWNVSGGSYVGGYNVACTPECGSQTLTASQSCMVDQNKVSASNPNGCITGTGLIMTATNLTIYFTQVPAGPVTVTYAVYGPGINPNEAIATTTFNVVGPTGPGISVFGMIKNAAIYPGPPPLLQMGSSQPGIGFFGSETPPSQAYPGTLTFVQKVTSVSITLGNQSCGSSGGLDGNYPYQNQTFPYEFQSFSQPQAGTASLYDTPSIQLESSRYTSQSDSNSFEMYLMWQPMYYPNSIPVPIGYITWGWGGGASYISPNWVLTNGTTSTAMVTQPTTMYPTWTRLNPIPVPGCPPL